MNGRRRARKVEQKQERRQAILDTAWHLFQATTYPALTMAEVAERAGLAKGTIYLYFKTKEQLFLALQAQQLKEWFADIDERLAATQDGSPIADVAALICASLAQRPAFTRLLAILHTVIEQNVDFATALDFKQMLRSHVTRTGALLEQRLPFLVAGQGAQLLLRITALVIGLQHLADPAPLVRNVLREPDMQLFTIHFANEFSEMLDALLRGLACAAEERRQPERHSDSGILPLG